MSSIRPKLVINPSKKRERAQTSSLSTHFIEDHLESAVEAHGCGGGAQRSRAPPPLSPQTKEEEREVEREGEKRSAPLRGPRENEEERPEREAERRSERGGVREGARENGCAPPAGRLRMTSSTEELLKLNFTFKPKCMLYLCSRFVITYPHEISAECVY